MGFEAASENEPLASVRLEIDGIVVLDTGVANAAPRGTVKLLTGALHEITATIDVRDSAKGRMPATGLTEDSYPRLTLLWSGMSQPRQPVAPAYLFATADVVREQRLEVIDFDWRHGTVSALRDKYGF